jgi:hypothetical protein
MELLRVVYELFESDAEHLDQQSSMNWHEIDREIRLEGKGGEQVYISWGWQDSPAQYAIEMSPQPFFTPPAPITRDMSGSLLWAGLIGKEVTFAYLDPGHQILEVRAGAISVYCSSHDLRRGLWMIDVLHVSATRPSGA